MHLTEIMKLTKFYQEILERNGLGLLDHYNKSHIKLIKSSFPNYNWLPWKFNGQIDWKDENNIKEYMNWLSNQLNIKTMEDWYKVSLLVS